MWALGSTAAHPYSVYNFPPFTCMHHGMSVCHQQHPSKPFRVKYRRCSAEHQLWNATLLQLAEDRRNIFWAL